MGQDLDTCESHNAEAYARQKAKQKQYRAANVDKIREYQKQYRVNNLDKYALIIRIIVPITQS